ncbi:MAG: hypothetical protein ACOYK7_10615 [Pirellulales bacterium]|jgi:hypothetical protein
MNGALLPLAAMWLGGLPGIFVGLPLLVVASIVFAATHHEQPVAILRATVHWIGWLGGILGAVLAAVLLVGWMV